MSTIANSPVPHHGQRVYHRSFGLGRVSPGPSLGGSVVRVRFDSGSEPLVRAADILTAADVEKGGRLYYISGIFQYAHENGLNSGDVLDAVQELGRWNPED